MHFSSSSTTLPTTTMDINDELSMPSSYDSGIDNNGDDGDAPTPPLDDVSNYIEGKSFFKLLQDEGVEPKEDEKFEYDRDKSKTKAKHIRFGDRLYPKIWEAARDLYKILKNKKDIVPKISSNPTYPLRFIGVDEPTNASTELTARPSKSRNAATKENTFMMVV